jgi:hypothetical protein
VVNFAQYTIDCAGEMGLIWVRSRFHAKSPWWMHMTFLVAFELTVVDM